MKVLEVKFLQSEIIFCMEKKQIVPLKFSNYIVCALKTMLDSVSHVPKIPKSIDIHEFFKSQKIRMEYLLSTSFKSFKDFSSKNVFAIFLKYHKYPKSLVFQELFQYFCFESLECIFNFKSFFFRRVHIENMLIKLFRMDFIEKVFHSTIPQIGVRTLKLL